MAENRFRYRSSRPIVLVIHEKDVLVALRKSTGTGFEAPKVWLKDQFTNGHGWLVSTHPRHVIDVNADGYADIVGFGANHIYVALNNTTGGFQSPAVWNVGP